MVAFFTLYGSKPKGGDGGAAERQAKEDRRIAQAVQKLNEVFGVAEATPDAVDRNQFVRQVAVQDQPTQTQMQNNPRLPMYGAPRTRGVGINNIGVAQPMQNVFDQAGFDAAVGEANASAGRMRGSAGRREGLYGKIANDAKATALLDLGKERQDTERDLGFMLARQGLTGGSRDIDVNRDILDTNQQGILKASNLGMQIANDARSSDDRTRVNLINSIRAGLDQGSAQQQAFEGMRNNANSAADAARGASLNGFFDTIRQRQQQAAYQNGFNQTSAPPAIKPAVNKNGGGGGNANGNSFDVP